MAPGRGHPPSPVKIHKIDKIERLKDRSIIPSVRFSAVGRSDIGILLKNNMTFRDFFVGLLKDKKIGKHFQN